MVVISIFSSLPLPLGSCWGQCDLEGSHGQRGFHLIGRIWNNSECHENLWWGQGRAQVCPSKGQAVPLCPAGWICVPWAQGMLWGVAPCPSVYRVAGESVGKGEHGSSWGTGGGDCGGGSGGPLHQVPEGHLVICVSLVFLCLKHIHFSDFEEIFA